MSKFFKLKIKEKKQETDDCVSITFHIPDELKEQFQYKQGQFLTLRATINNEDVRRSYSICSSPYINEDLRIAVKKVDNGVFSNFANQTLKVNDEIEVLPPAGRFFTELDVRNSKKYLGIAAGSGITPIISIIKSILSVEPKSTFTLLYSNRNIASIIFKEQIEDLKNVYLERLNVIHVFSRMHQGVELFNGRLNADKLIAICQKAININAIDDVFICGPKQIIDDAIDVFQNYNFDKKNIHFELFASPNQHKQNQNEIVDETNLKELNDVSIVIDGKTHLIKLAHNGKNVLDAALDFGLDVPFACKGAVCCTCRAKVMLGEVDMKMNYSLTDDEVNRGYVLTCQSHPISKKVTIDFDQP